MLGKWLPWRRRLPDQEFIEMEYLLQSTLYPIKPRVEYIKGLRRRIVNYSHSGVGTDVGMDTRRNQVYIMAGLLSVVFILSIGIKIIINLINNKGSLQVPKFHIGRKQTASIIPPV